MTEKCTVKKIKNGIAYVELRKSEKCGTCKACNFYGDNVIILPAIIQAECKVGDSVTVQMPQKCFRFSVIFLFIIPLLMFLTGLIIGMQFSELVMFLLGTIFLLLGIGISILFDRFFIKKNKKYSPIIIEKN